MADGVGKVVESTTLSFSPSCSCAVAWSPDDRISVLTDKCIYVFTLWSSSRSTKVGILHEKTSVLSRGAHLIPYVGIKREKVIPEPESGPVSWNHERLMHVFDCSLNDLPTGPLQYTGFSAAAWSPLGCDKNHRCILASLSIDHQLTLHNAPQAMLRNWQTAADLTGCLHQFLRQSNYQIDDFLDCDHAQETSAPSQTKFQPSFSEFRRRLHLLACTSVVWCSSLYDSGTGASIGEGGSILHRKFALLAAGTRSGHVIFFKISVPILETPASVSIVGFLKPQLDCVCCLAWYSGMLAIGTTDGLAKLYTLKVDASSPKPVAYTARCTLWSNKDSMPVRAMTILPQAGSESTMHLAVSKGPAVVLFQIQTRDGQVLEQPTYKLVRGIHCQSITGQSCSVEGTVFTSGIRGTVQKFSADKPEPLAVSTDMKHPRTCHGLSVSSSGLFLVMLHGQTKNAQIKKEGRHLQVNIVSMVTPSSLARAVLALYSRPCGKMVPWDLLEAVRQIVAEGTELPEVLSNAILDKEPQLCPLAVLYLRRHLVSLLATRAETDETSVKDLEPRHDWAEEMMRVEKTILEVRVTDLLSSWLSGQKSGETNEADGNSALIMSDWLIQNRSSAAGLATAQQVYDAQGDPHGTRALSAIRDASSNRTEAARVRAIYAEHDSEETPPSKRKKASHSLSEGTGVVDPHSEESTQVSQDETPQSDSKPSRDRRPPDDGSSRPSHTRDLLSGTSEQADDEISIEFPAREKCDLCGCGIPLRDMKFGTCGNGHSWKRCAVSHSVTSEFARRRCVICGACVSLPNSKASPWLLKHLNAVVKCPACSNWLV